MSRQPDHDDPNQGQDESQMSFFDELFLGNEQLMSEGRQPSYVENAFQLLT